MSCIAHEQPSSNKQNVKWAAINIQQVQCSRCTLRVHLKRWNSQVAAHNWNWKHSFWWKKANIRNSEWNAGKFLFFFLSAPKVVLGLIFFDSRASAILLSKKERNLVCVPWLKLQFTKFPSVSDKLQIRVTRDYACRRMDARTFSTMHKL